MRIILSLFFIVSLTSQQQEATDEHSSTVVHSNTTHIEELGQLDEEHLQTLLDIQQMENEFEEKVDTYIAKIDGKIADEDVYHLVREANRHKVPSHILLNLLKVESNFQEDAVGPQTAYGRAYGIAQFMTNTAPWIADMSEMDYSKDLLLDVQYSITLAAAYLHFLQYGDDQYHDGYDNWHSSLTAYHRGMAGMQKFKQRQQTTISWYSEKIMDQNLMTLN